MNKFLVRGTCRPIGSLGKVEPFEIGVYADKPQPTLEGGSTVSPEAAARIALSGNWEHVHIEQIEEVK